LDLLHFGSCLVMAGDVPRRIFEARGMASAFPISGFRREADWAGSAIVDFTYLELMLGRRMKPAAALEATRRMVSFATDATDAPVEGSDLVLFEPARTTARERSRNE